jgi:hypothetical protein
MADEMIAAREAAWARVMDLGTRPGATSIRALFAADPHRAHARTLHLDDLTLLSTPFWPWPRRPISTGSAPACSPARWSTRPRAGRRCTWRCAPPPAPI